MKWIYICAKEDLISIEIKKRTLHIFIFTNKREVSTTYFWIFIHYIQLPERFSKRLSGTVEEKRGKKFLSIIIDLLKMRCQLQKNVKKFLAKIKLQKRRGYGNSIRISIDRAGLCHESDYGQKRVKWPAKLARRAAIEKE